MKPRYAIECISGEMPGIILSLMPSKSKLIMYGNLSKTDMCEINPLLLIGRDQKIETFFLGSFLQKKYVWGILAFLGRVQKQLYNSTLHSKVRKVVSLDELPAAIEEYVETMSGGKILVAPNK